MVGLTLRRIRLWALSVPLGLLFLLAAGCTSASDLPADSPDASPEVTRPQPLANTERSQATSPASAALDELPDLVEGVVNSVVLIENVSGPGSGSGIVLDTDGHILTNYHVIEQMGRVKVGLYDGSASLATVVGTDPNNDLAVLKADGFSVEQLQPATMGDSSEVRVGQRVFAIGNPFNERFTVTQGIISAVNRSSSSFGGRSIQGVLQTDAALNPGNSGGPLFNLAGEVIGINTSIRNPQGQSFAGLGFAVPSNTAARYLPQLIAGETIRHPQLGVSGPVRLDEVVAAELGVVETQGLYLMSITPGGAASQAGMMPGDVMLELNGQQTRSFEELARAIENASVGDEVEILLSRNGEQMTVTAVLQPWESS